MDLGIEEKVAILLNRLDFHTAEIQRRQENETKLFEWSTALLLAVFAVVIAVSDITAAFSNPFVVKLVASFLVIMPASVFAMRILSEKESLARQAEVIEAIQEELYFFDKGYYLKEAALYPNYWRGNLAKSMLKRKTPVYYVSIMGIMTACVVFTIWLIK